MGMFFAALDLKVWQVSIFQMYVLVKFLKSPGKIRCPNKFGATCFKTLDLYYYEFHRPAII